MPTSDPEVEKEEKDESGLLVGKQWTIVNAVLAKATQTISQDGCISLLRCFFVTFLE
jgi:hypothetical protein